MALPSGLLQAVSAPGGGKIALVVGAGCSVEEPTCVPVGREWSREVHRRLIDDGVLQNGDCSDPDDLSLVADAVFAKRGSQRDLVERFRDQYDLKLASPNDGYRNAAAMLYEGTISSIVTLNFDLALSNALSELGAGEIVGVIECPQDLPRQKVFNIYYLHRNVNAPDPELWVLRSAALKEDWRGHWEPIITTRVLTAPVVVFAGLGTPIGVLIESVKLLRGALPTVRTLYHVDPADKADSMFFKELALDDSAYIQCGWCEFMDHLSQRLLIEQIVQLERAIGQKIRNDRLRPEDVADLLGRLKVLGLVKFGKLRANWLLHNKQYCPVDPHALSLIADLLLALAMVGRISGAVAVIVEDGLVEFHRDGRPVVAYMIASGRGYRGRVALETALELRRRQYRSCLVRPCGAFVGGTSGAWATTVTPPTDVIRGDVSDDIVAGSAALTLLHIDELRADPDRVRQVVP